MAGTQYEIREVPVVARAVAGVRARVPRGRVTEVFGRYLDQVYAAGRAGAVTLDGQNVFIYREATETELVAEFCVGVVAPFEATGAVMPLSTPSGVAVMTTHFGDYRKLGDANAALRAWCQEHGRQSSGPSWKVYGHWHEDVAQLRTDVYYLLKPEREDVA